MNSELKDDLLSFSNTVCSIHLKTTSIQRLIWLYEEQDLFVHSNDYQMQNLLINVDDKYINIVLRNLSKAILTNCGNSIELDDVQIPKNFGYSVTPDYKKRSINKIYKNFKIKPQQEHEFKVIWLKDFIQNLKRIDCEIRSILQLPQNDYDKLKPVNIFNRINEYEIFTKHFQQKLKEEFQKPVPKSEKINLYFNELLPNYFNKTDKLFIDIERMRASFKRQFGYLDNEYKSLNNIVSKLQISEINRIENLINRVHQNDFEYIRNRFLNVIMKITSNNKLEEKDTSIFINELFTRITNFKKSQLIDDNLEGSNNDESINDQKVELLNEIWLPNAKISVEDFLEKGIDKGIWNENLDLITKRNSSFGKGKTLLGSMFIALKGWSVSRELDYKEAGKILCEVFNIDIKSGIENPFKSFSSGNQKYITEFKRQFNIKNS